MEGGGAMDHLGEGTSRQQSKFVDNHTLRSKPEGPGGDEPFPGTEPRRDSVTLSTERPHKTVSLSCIGAPGSIPGSEKDIVVGTPRATGYYPADDPVQGGFVDIHDNPLCTLQDHVAGKVPHVSLAFDRELYTTGVISYGDIFSIPELDEKYAKHLTFKSVDTGSAFTGTKFTRIDICCKTREDTFDPSVNRVLTLIKAG
jgi:hypothetical protein